MSENKLVITIVASGEVATGKSTAISLMIRALERHFTIHKKQMPLPEIRNSQHAILEVTLDRENEI